MPTLSGDANVMETVGQDLGTGSGGWDGLRVQSGGILGQGLWGLDRGLSAVRPLHVATTLASLGFPATWLPKAA